MDALRKAEIELNNEYFKQIDIIYGSTALALFRHWGWKHLRILRMFDEAVEAREECASYGIEVSILEMLENETGIEMRIPQSQKSFHELAFFNNNLKVGTKSTMTKAQWILMRKRQKEWCGAGILADIFLALHRKEKFGPERLRKLMEQIEEISTEYKYSRKLIVDQCYKETGVCLKGAFTPAERRQA